MALTKIPGNLIETGAITGDVLADGGIATAKLADAAVTTDKILDANITHAKLHTSMDLTGKTVTVATAAGSTNTTAAASTAFVQQELTTLIGGAPSTLNDLNELAAAINDDANYNTTLTTALATKLPLAGGTLTGDLNSNSLIKTTGNITTASAQPTLFLDRGNGSYTWGIYNGGGTDFPLSSFNIANNAGTAVITALNSGNVGIGTDAPTSKLDVNSTAYVNTDSTQALRFTYNGSPRAMISAYGGEGELSLYRSSNAKNIYISSYYDSYFNGGKVGIGITNPAQPLHVLSSTALTAGVARFQYSGGNDYEVIRVESLGNNDAHIGFFADGDTNYYGGFGIDYSDAGKFKLQTDNLFVGGSNLMTWDRDGKVGINNTGPTVNLDVYNGSGWGGIDIDGTSGGELRFQKAGTNYGQIYGNDSSGFVVNALSGLEELSLQAGSTLLLYLKKSTETVLVRQGKLKTSITNAIIKKSCNFSNGVANQKVDFYIAPNYWGNFTVSITSSYSNQNAPGALTKQFGVGLNPNGAIYSNESKITEEIGFTAGNFAISDIVWDASPADGSGIGKYKFTIVHRVSSSNACELTITGNAAGASDIDNLVTMTQSAVYTTDTTVYNKQTRDVAFFSTAAAQALTTTPTKINFNTNVFDEGGNMSNGVFTAPQKGVYTFQVNYLVYPHTNGIITTWFYKNGSQYGPGVQMGWDGGSHTQVSNGTLINLDKGDTVDHRAARGGGTGTPNVYGGQNCFYGHII